MGGHGTQILHFFFNITAHHYIGALCSCVCAYCQDDAHEMFFVKPLNFHSSRIHSCWQKGENCQVFLKVGGGLRDMPFKQWTFCFLLQYNIFLFLWGRLGKVTDVCSDKLGVKKHLVLTTNTQWWYRCSIWKKAYFRHPLFYAFFYYIFE